MLGTDTDSGGVDDRILLPEPADTAAAAGAPYLLHLDSLDRGGHDTNFVVAKLREYLTLEWSRQNPAEVVSPAEEVVPAGAGAGAGARAGAIKAAAAAAAAAGPDFFGQASLPHERMRIPLQDNDSDCGLFLLTCIERFITPKMPEVLSAAEITAAHSGAQLVNGSKLPAGFLRQDWFAGPQTAAWQRSRITLLILEHIFSALPDPDAAAAEGASDAAVKELRAERMLVSKNLNAVIEEYRNLAEQRRSLMDQAVIPRPRRLARPTAKSLAASAAAAKAKAKAAKAVAMKRSAASTAAAATAPHTGEGKRARRK